MWMWALCKRLYIWLLVPNGHIPTPVYSTAQRVGLNIRSSVQQGGYQEWRPNVLKRVFKSGLWATSVPGIDSTRRCSVSETPLQPFLLSLRIYAGAECRKINPAWWVTHWTTMASVATGLNYSRYITTQCGSITINMQYIWIQCLLLLPVW